MRSDDARATATTLWILLFLFLLRVLGQALVLAFSPAFLPPMASWYSGLIPYPILLVSQILIILALAKVCLDVQRQRGFWGTPWATAGKGLLGFGLIYLAAMVIRYLVRMALLPQERWTGGCIPIFFHWVLAAFVLRLAFFHLHAFRGSPKTG